MSALQVPLDFLSRVELSTGKLFIGDKGIFPILRSCRLVLPHQLIVSYSPGGYSVSALPVRLLVFVSPIVQFFPLFLCVSQLLSLSFSLQVAFSDEAPLVTP